jgi:TonB family protein
VWEATSRAGLHSDSSGLTALAADQLEKNVNSILGASAAAASGKKLLHGSIAVILLLVAGLLIWQSRRTAVPEQFSEEPAVPVSQSEIDAPPSAQTPSGTTSVPEAHPGTSETDATSPSNNSNHDGRPAVAVVVPDSSARAGTAPTVSGVLQSTASNAAKLQQMPAPTLARSNLTLGAIQDLPSFQPALPQAPLPLPPGPAATAVKNIVPGSTRTTSATPAVPLTRVQPVYPELARKMNVVGTVHVAIVVDTAGNVISAKAVDGPQLLRGSAELAVKHWRFRPSTMNGQPVTGSGTVSVMFNPDRR